jgi:hypothetical protein
MRIEIEIPDTLPEDRRSSFKKGIADALLEASTTVTSYEHPPKGMTNIESKATKLAKC